MNGYIGKQLRINLREQSCSTEILDNKVLRKYIGGVGYSAKVLYDEMSPGTDALGAQNKIILATGPLTLQKIPGGGSIEICFKSPLTGGWGQSRAGSDFGINLKKAGYDFVIIEECAESPVYCLVQNGEVSFYDASHLLGKFNSEKQAIIKNELNEKSVTSSSIITIGPAGENLVLFSTVMCEDRSAGRTGAGAVFGSKNLIGFAVAGETKVPEANADELQKLLKETHKTVRDNPVSAGFREFGTMGDLPGNDDSGDLPTKNWQSNSWGKGTAVFDTYQENNYIKSYPCYKGCTISCGRKVHVPVGPYKTPEHGGGEYESVACFTSFVLNENVDAAIHSTYLCNEYGIDTISAGSVIAFAIECREKNLIPSNFKCSVELEWGNGAILPELVRMIALRENIGDLLAKGVREASRILGSKTQKMAIHVKGLEGPAHDLRSGKALGLSYATGNRGMCHIQPVEAMAWDSGKMDWGLQKYGLRDPETVDRWDEDGKAPDVKLLQDALSLPDILGTCKFFMYAGVTVKHLSDMLSALTGWDIDDTELLLIGERTINIQRLFNIREGFGRKDDQLPERTMTVPAMGKYKGETNCVIKDFNKLLDDYYLARGWTQAQGCPGKEKLIKLGIEE
jgi:aldehyde:ferredoxin oxidoreductase